MERDKKMAGMVVLFDPDDSVRDNISSYLGIVDTLFVFDNSTRDNRKLLEGLDARNIEYFHNGHNDGVSHALNFCSRIAVDKGYGLLLTMDQDSYFPRGMAAKYADYIAGLDFEQTPLVSPWHNTRNYRIPPRAETSFVAHVPTSGNVIDLEVLRKLGYFEEKLFIDYVDIEYCSRLTSKGYRILQINSIELIHNLGNLVEKRVLFRKVSVTHHAPVRYYYRVRNRLYVTKKYFFRLPKQSLTLIRLNITDAVKVLLYENNKAEKTGKMLLGVWHFLISRYGKYERRAGTA